MIAQRPAPRQMENCASSSKIIFKNKNWTFTVVRHFAQKPGLVSNTLWRVSVKYPVRTKFQLQNKFFSFLLNLPEKDTFGLKQKNTIELSTIKLSVFGLAQVLNFRLKAHSDVWDNFRKSL